MLRFKLSYVNKPGWRSIQQVIEDLIIVLIIW